MEKRTSLVRRGESKSDAMTGRKETHADGKAQESKRANRSNTTQRQRDLEERKEEARSHRKSLDRRIAQTSQPRAKTRTVDLEAGAESDDDEPWEFLGESTQSAVTLSNTPESRTENDYVVRLLALLPHDRERYFKGRLDHGCFVCLISMKVVKRFDLDVDEVDNALDLRGVSRYTEVTNKCTKLDFQILPWKRPFRVDFWILEKECMANDVILGRKFLEQRLGMRTNKVWKRITMTTPELLAT